MRFDAAIAWTVSNASRTTPVSSTFWRSRCNCPRAMRETSSRSAISRICDWALRSTTVRRLRAQGGIGRLLPEDVHPAMIACSGVRSSCESTPRNSSFSRLASRASAATALSSVVDAMRANCIKRSSSSA
jgi:hypothetical protein